MESVETRKLGKHLFIFEKRKAKSPNGIPTGRTLITSCRQTDAENILPPEFVKYMRTLFDILDEHNAGFVKLSDIEACWGQRNGDSTSQGTSVLEQLRKATPANGLLSFDRLCMGFGQALRSNESISIPNGSAGASRESSKAGQNSDSRRAPKHQSAFNGTPSGQRSPVSEIQVDKQGETISFPVVPEKFSEFNKRNGIRENPVSNPNSEIGLNHKRKPEQNRPKSVGHGTGEPKENVKLSFAVNNCSYRHGQEERSRPTSTGPFNQPHEETTHVPFSQTNPYKSSEVDQNFDPDLYKTDAVFIRKPHVRKRPKSMTPFSDQKRAVDFSVAKKKGGLLEGIEKTDKKAVIDKLKQWRTDELKKSGSLDKNGVSTVEFRKAAQGYQSDNEGGYCRQRRTVAPVGCSGNESDIERHRQCNFQCKSMQFSSKKNNGVRLPKTTVYYQGQIQTKIGENDSSLKITAESKASETEITRDVASAADEFRVLKEGLRIVDEIRDCLVKRIADIQEQKLYNQLNIVSSDTTYKITKYEDVGSKAPEEGRQDFGKTGIVLDSSHIDSLSVHFKGLKTILDEVKQPRSNR